MALTAAIKKLAVDSNVLFDLAAGQDFAHTFREVLQERGYSLRVPPTVVQELAFIGFKKKAVTPEEKTEANLARGALTQMRSWSIIPFDLVPVGHGITEQFSKKLQHLGCLPDEEFNDGLILAETSLACIPVLITSDHHLLEIESVRLRTCFESLDLIPVAVAKPSQMMKAIR